MKTQAVAARSKSGRGSRALPPALKGPRPAGSAHEREAADSGVRFVRGESGLRSALTPAAAAHWALPGSVSRAMPTALRTSLEAAFDADLAGLRVHDDAPAHRSAAAVGARAFTAGNAIYFAEGAWAPDRAGGRELIAHEVAHALQQAGRASHGHRWRLEPAAWGEAGVQRDADHNDEVRKAKTKLSAGLEIGAQFKSLGFMQPTTDTEECKAVVERHLQLPEDAAVKTQGEKIKAAVDGKSITEAVAAVDGLLSTIAEADKTDRIKAFFFDVYKSLDADDKALAVVGEALPEQTAFGSWSFYLAHRRGDAKWVTGFLKKHAVGGKYWPQMVAAVARIDFYGVTRGGLNLDPQMKFNTTMGDAIVDALLYQPTMPDERTVAALRALVGFDVIRLIPFAELARAVKDEKSLINRMGYKLSLIKRYVDPQYLVRVANGNSAEPEVVQIAAEAGALMAPIAERALNFWESVKALGQAVLVGSQADAAAKAQSARFQAVMRKRLPTLKPMAGVEKKLLPILAQALKLQAGTVPSPKLMEGNFAAAAKQVEGLVNQLDGAIAERDKKIKVGALPAASQDPNADTETDPSAQESEAITDDMVYGVVLFLLFALQSSMVQYKAPDASKDEGRRIQDQDAAVSQYHALSRGFFNLADMLGYQSLQAAAADVRYARQAGLATSYVGLMAPFEKVPATLKDFTRDFPTGELVGGAITGAMLVRTVYAMYYQNLLDKLTKALDAPVEGGTTREFDYAAGKKPIINAALDAVDASLQLPRKYRVPQEATILYVRDEDRGKTSTFLSRKHPILKQLIADELGADENGYIPESYYSHADGFVVWIIPGMGKFVEQLANVPGVVDLTLPDGKVLGKPSDYPKPSDWLEALNQAAGSDEATKKKLTDAVKDWLDKSLHDLDAPLRRATNNERNKARPLIEEQWEKVNKSFLKDPKAFFEAPRTALKYTLTFAGNIAPSTKDEQLLQMTALMLELAPVLVRKLGESTTFGSLVTISGTDRLDIVLPLYAHVSGAAHLAQSGAFGPAMPKLAMAFGADDLDRRTRQLTTLAGEFKATAAKAQEDVKLEGLPGENMLRVPNRGYPVVGKQSNADNSSDDIFQADGIVYQLVQVHRNFLYEPELMAHPSFVPWDEEDLSARKLKVDGRDVAESDPAIDLVTIMRTTPDRQVSKITITSNNTKMLSELTYAVHMHIVVRQLEDLAGALEVFADVIMTAMQIAFPEIAPEIAYAEIAGTIVQFLASPEFAAMKGALDSDSGSLFKQGLNAITKDLKPDTLWDYLLFDTLPPLFETLRQAAQLVGRMGMFKNKGDDQTKSTFSKVFGRLMKVGGELVHGAEVVHEHIDFPVRKLSLFIEGSPWLAILMRTVANNLYRLEGMSLQELGAEKAIDVVTEVQQMYLRFEAVIDGLGDYELPEELVPLESIIAMVVNFIIDKLPAKYRLPLKGSRAIPQVEEVFQWIFKKAADELRSAKLDPNILWRDYARSAINPYLKDAGKAVSDEVHGFLTRVPFLHELATMNVSDVAMQFVTRDVAPAAQPKLAAGVGSPQGAPQLPAGEGVSLTPSARAQAQRGFGHDFSHVRVHRGLAIDAGLQQAGALGATSGSHVYLNSGMTPHDPQGREVLHHELAHVLQQTGPRPLGERHSSQAQRASAGGGSGWRIDAGAEGEADRLAREAHEPARAPRRVRSAHGMQPKLTDIIAKFFQKVGDPSKLQENAEEMMKHPVDKKALKQAAPDLKDSFADKLIAALNTAGNAGSPVSFASPFDTVGKNLVDYVANNRKEELQTGLPHVLMTGLREIERKTGKGTSKAGTEKFWIVEPDRVETALEEFFFGVTGISVDVEFNLKKEEGADGKERKTIDADKPFSTLKFNYLHLPMVGGTAKLWQDIMDHSFPKLSGDKRALYQTKARLALQGLQPGPGIYSSATVKGAKVLVFGTRARDLIETYINPPPDRDLPGNAVPKWADYIKTDPQARAKVGGVDYGQIGLRLGFYKDRSNADQQKGTDRSSHHTVQYLLLEYFVNSKDRHKPFPNSLSLYPNLVGSGGRVDVVSDKAGGADGIKISANEGDRGGPMPTILLSQHAHTLGDVHISAKPDDLPTEAPSQGAAIHGEFRAKLGDYADIVLGKPAPLQAIANKAQGKTFKAADIPKVGGQEVTQDMLSQAIFKATCRTYSWMRKTMNDKLERALDTREIEYYEALVKAATDASIYANNQPQAGYTTAKVGGSIRAEVVKKQAATLESAAFGFKEMN